MIEVLIISFCRRDSSPVKTLGVTATLFSPEVVQVLDMPVDPNEPTYCICHQVTKNHTSVFLIVFVNAMQN